MSIFEILFDHMLTQTPIYVTNCINSKTILRMFDVWLSFYSIFYIFRNVLKLSLKCMISQKNSELKYQVSKGWYQMSRSHSFLCFKQHSYFLIQQVALPLASRDTFCYSFCVVVHYFRGYNSKWGFIPPFKQPKISHN